MLFVPCEAIATVHIIFPQDPREANKNFFFSPSSLLYSANRRERDTEVSGGATEREGTQRWQGERASQGSREGGEAGVEGKMEVGVDARLYHVFMAKLAEKAERYDDLVESMKKVARLDIELTAEERNLLSVGYKNVIGARRSSWLILSSLEKQEEAKESQRSKQHVIWMRKYKKDIEDEISKLCNDALSIIAIHLLPSSATGESLVHYYKLKGDYYRYLAEFRTGNERQELADQSLRAYQAATSTAVMDLPSSHPIRLSLALNLSVFYYEIMGSTERACQLAQQAFDEAVTEITLQGDDSSQDSIPIMQLIQGNLTLWTSDPEQGGEQCKDIGIEMQQG